MLSGSRGERFGRMFPFLPVRDPGVGPLDKLATAMGRLPFESGENSLIPAGYTYLGQFIDHDITFDATSTFERDNDPSALVNFRTPRFDLDSLYGSGPADQPYLYDWDCQPHQGVKLLVTCNPDGGDLARLDLPRNEQGRALIGDARNDENLIVSQLHLLFIRFHNRVVDDLCNGPAPPAGKALFEESRRIVRWHYQWIVVHDFLRRIVGRTMAGSVMSSGDDTRPGVTRRPLRWPGEPFIPVEFSGAAFRFAHSMVRPEYVINSIPAIPGDPPKEHSVPILAKDEHAADDEHLGGLRRLLGSLEIQWGHFFEIDTSKLNASVKIDEHLAEPLFRLPIALTLGDVPGPPQPPASGDVPNTTQLARLNLRRGRALGLPDGKDVARAMGEDPLSQAELFPSSGGVALDGETKDALLRATPLWYYVLREAKTRNPRGSLGLRLGPVGGGIVAAVLVGLLEADAQSYLRERPTWRPTLPRCKPDDFEMRDLVCFALGREPPPAA